MRLTCWLRLLRNRFEYSLPAGTAWPPILVEPAWRPLASDGREARDGRPHPKSPGASAPWRHHLPVRRLPLRSRRKTTPVPL